MGCRRSAHGSSGARESHAGFGPSHDAAVLHSAPGCRRHLAPGVSVLRGDYRAEARRHRSRDGADVDALANELEQRVPKSRFLFQMQLVQGLRWKSQAEPDLERARAFFKQVTLDETGRGTETAARSQFLIAETYLLQNETKTALKEYYRVYLSYPFDEWRARGLFQSGGCEQQLGNVSASIKCYQDLIKEFPDNALVPTAEEKLAELSE